MNYRRVIRFLHCRHQDSGARSIRTDVLCPEADRRFSRFQLFQIGLRAVGRVVFEGFEGEPVLYMPVSLRNERRQLLKHQHAHRSMTIDWSGHAGPEARSETSIDFIGTDRCLDIELIDSFDQCALRSSSSRFLCRAFAMSDLLVRFGSPVGVPAPAGHLYQTASRRITSRRTTFAGTACPAMMLRRRASQASRVTRLRSIRSVRT